MNNALNQIIYILTIVIEKVAELMSKEKGSDNGLKLNHALLKLEEVKIILDEINESS